MQNGNDPFKCEGYAALFPCSQQRVDTSESERKKEWYEPDEYRAIPAEVERRFVDEIIKPKLIQNYLKKWIHDPVEIEDIAQDIIIKLLGAAGSFFKHFNSSKSSLTYFIYITTHNYVQSYFKGQAMRKRKAQMVNIDNVNPQSLEDYSQSAMSVQKQIEYDDKVSELRDFIAGMDNWAKFGATYLEVFDLILAGESTKDIAKHFEVSPARIQQVRSQIRQAVRASAIEPLTEH